MAPPPGRRTLAPRTDGPDRLAAPTLEASVDSLSYGGRGVARVDGRVVFVARTAPGDLVTCRVTRSHRSFLEADLVSVLTPGPGRRPAPCPRWEECGGCHLMHLEYPGQLDAKRRFVADALRRIGRTCTDPEPVVAAPSQTAYRRRATLRVRRAAGSLSMGFLRGQTHELVDVERCLVLVEPLSRALLELRSLLSGRDAPLAFRLDAVCDQRGRIGFSIHSDRAGHAALIELARLVEPIAQDVRVVDDEGHAVVERAEPGAFSYELSGPGDEPLEIAFSLGSFTQINFEQNRRLVHEIVTLASEIRPHRALDLYSGVGNYSVPLARVAGEVVSVESAPGAVRDATLNAARSRAANVRAVRSPAAAAVRDLARAGESFDLVVLNPTRAGAEGVVESLAGIAARHLVYVSCNPTTLARDLGKLATAGFRLVRVAPIDLFPQTYHVETLAVLERSQSR